MLRNAGISIVFRQRSRRFFQSVLFSKLKNILQNKKRENYWGFLQNFQSPAKNKYWVSIQFQNIEANFFCKDKGFLISVQSIIQKQ